MSPLVHPDPKERPIVFSGEMVRAILEGRKTQTRRPIHPGPGSPPKPNAYFDAYDGGPQWNWWTADNRVCNASPIMECPFGIPGERLWVQESIRICGVGDDDGAPATEPPVFYMADGECPDKDSWPHVHLPTDIPRWASRLILEVTEVRVQYIKEISHEDALAEGCRGHDWVKSTPYIAGPHTDDGLLPEEEFQMLWDHEYLRLNWGWDANPWVWAITFKIADVGEGASE